MVKNHKNRDGNSENPSKTPKEKQKTPRRPPTRSFRTPPRASQSNTGQPRPSARGRAPARRRPGPPPLRPRRTRPSRAGRSTVPRVAPSSAVSRSPVLPPAEASGSTAAATPFPNPAAAVSSIAATSVWRVWIFRRVRTFRGVRIFRTDGDGKDVGGWLCRFFRVFGFFCDEWMNGGVVRGDCLIFLDRQICDFQAD